MRQQDVTIAKNYLDQPEIEELNRIVVMYLDHAEDQAAAVMEVVRFVGRSLVSNPEIRSSQATAMCLASIAPTYDRPEWFAEKLADMISAQAGNRRAREVGQYLTK